MREPALNVRDVLPRDRGLSYEQLQTESLRAPTSLSRAELVGDNETLVGQLSRGPSTTAYCLSWSWQLDFVVGVH